MTRELAIKVIKRMIKTGIAYDDGYAFEPLTQDEEKACGMAIKALEEQEPKQGHWIETNGTILNHRNQILHEVICSECCGVAYFRSIGNEYIGANLCPNCGCRMESEG